MSMLMNGFKYIIPCQSRLCSRQSINEIIQEQYQKIASTVKDCLNDHRIPIASERTTQIFSELERTLHQLQTQKLSKVLEKRAQYEYKIVRTIQRLIHRRKDIVVRRTDKNKVFYIGKAIDFERKAEEYMLKTDAYQEIPDGHCPLADNLHAVKTLLDYLLGKHALTKNQYNQLSPNLKNLELGHYHGLPKPHKPQTPLRPIIASIRAPATLVSQFLNDLLAPIYLDVTRKYTFINDIDVIRTLEKHAANGYVTSTTKFITSDVENLYTMIPRKGALEALGRFCIRHSKQGKIGTFAIDHIMKMARVILDTNCFAYNKKYYKQIRGGAMGSAFTQVLANIYMFEWEQDLIQYQETHNGIYGRTSIYHKPTTEPYILPYTSDHPHHIHRNIPYEALLRAARICSHVNDFNSERIRIDMSLLLNSYPPNFITKQLRRFFRLNSALPVLTELNEDVYHHLHQTLLQQPTRREKKLINMMHDSIDKPFVLQPKIRNKEIMYPCYLFDTSLTSNLPNQFYKWWQTNYAFPRSPLEQIKVMLVANTNRTLESFFIHKKPPRELLTKMETI
ncbi:unnamed protein product [Rotaria sp. Silwood1]|nr:unnamed protein product [Rotaria sp. Silwood1]